MAAIIMLKVITNCFIRIHCYAEDNERIIPIFQISSKQKELTLYQRIN